MTDIHERTRLLIGDEAHNRIRSRSVFIAGLGGVGGYIAEALVRAGIEQLTIHDADIITKSNINRQIIALHSTIGEKKTDAMKKRLLDINPGCQIITQDGFITKEVVPEVIAKEYDVVVDAIDVFNCKLAFLRQAFQKDCWLYSSMGAGNRIDPTKVKVGDLFESRNCRLAKILRKKLRHSGITQGIKAVWSEEVGHAPGITEEGKNRMINASISTIPGIFGLILAGTIIKDLIKDCY